ncbi:capsule biosynthesis protein [Rodentibacter trehalosifermentans]|uniref:Capsule biosynthesis protein n=1 Tax=Rodentibacter trehalosifermentans TaxID=1908263 RepID=A0A1V3IN68_9PAST|nr:capsule biosynthesis protein [Rodentibacter trehalosifermentans]OOF43712.1 capsule biosynthesis protein [Rodentibacter trehalosifermentans]OOF49738.1 capsule biosynthesis protein [Rodentibacter trehalosifermentans]OOF51652.1 capsule biosynthesis protein [Rodentibacter trehalosifermentans]
MIPHNLDELVQKSQKILLLQGPIGTFFTDLSVWLQSIGKTVYKINFNGGDEHFYPASIKNTLAYTDSVNQFYPTLIRFCQENRIDSIVCFGDNRKYHKIGKKVAATLGVDFWVFEEGYFRPNYVTLEKTGVNAFSTLPREARFFLEQAKNLPEPPLPLKLAKGFLPIAKRAIIYYVCAYLKRSNYPKYQHHRILNLKYYIKLWIKSAIKRVCYYLRDRTFAKQVSRGKLGKFFVIPLQVYDDTQVKVHCDYGSVEKFLKTVLQSFAENAPYDLNLIVKHHPMDRGLIDYRHIIDTFEQHYPQLKGRIFYIHDVPLPVLLRYGKGMVTINSTSGISALHHNMPVMTLGRANYHVEGLTYQGNLSDFWANPIPPNPVVFNAYRKYHLHKTMINGSFYNQVILKFPYNQ